MLGKLQTLSRESVPDAADSVPCTAAVSHPRGSSCHCKSRQLWSQAGLVLTTPTGAAHFDQELPCPVRINNGVFMTDRMQRMRVALQDALNADVLEIVDDSHLHVGHAGARDGRGHYGVRIVAACFRGQNPLARHRMIYAALGDLMDTDIHALTIRALTPEEMG